MMGVVHIVLLYIVRVHRMLFILFLQLIFGDIWRDVLPICLLNVIIYLNDY